MTGIGRSRMIFSRNSRPFMLRHLDVERDDVGIERLDRVARLSGSPACADDLDVGIAPQRGRDQAAHGGEVVDDEDPDSRVIARPRSR